MFAYDDDEDEDTEAECRKWLGTLLRSEDKIYNLRNLGANKDFMGMPVMNRLQFFCENKFESLLISIRRTGVVNSIPMSSKQFALFGAAIKLTWQCCPEVITGLLMLLDNLAEGPKENVVLVANDSELLSTIKNIAAMTTSLNNPFGLHMQVAAAKTILSRVQHQDIDFSRASVVGPDLNKRAKEFGFNSNLFPTKGVQPNRAGASCLTDQRRVCDNPGCFKIEDSEKIFGKCARCKSKAYCGKQCQAADWQCHKGICKRIKRLQRQGQDLSTHWVRTKLD